MNPNFPHIQSITSVYSDDEGTAIHRVIMTGPIGVQSFDLLVDEENIRLLGPTAMLTRTEWPWNDWLLTGTDGSHDAALITVATSIYVALAKGAQTEEDQWWEWGIHSREVPFVANPDILSNWVNQRHQDSPDIIRLHAIKESLERAPDVYTVFVEWLDKIVEKEFEEEVV